MSILKQSVGIDIAKLTFTACVCIRYIADSEKFSETRKFNNTKKGFNQLIKWVAKLTDKTHKVFYAMEATGIYYEPLAYHLNKIKKPVSVILPNKVSYFAKSHNIKDKTDPVDAMTIALMSCERNLSEWVAPSAGYKRLRAVTRLHKSLLHDKTQNTNRLKQLECGYEPVKLTLRMLKSNIKRLDKQLKQLELTMKEILKSDVLIWAKVKNLLTIKGVGLKTIAVVLAETQGFALFTNQRQLVSFCGYDVVKTQSGTSIKGKSRISKKGNSHIRAAMFFPAMSASNCNPKLKQIYCRINKNHSTKSIGLVAIQRRLLILIYALWKTNSPYIENFKENLSGFHEEEVPSSSSTRRVENKSGYEKVDGAQVLASTQNEHLYDQSSDALLRL